MSDDEDQEVTTKHTNTQSTLHKCPQCDSLVSTYSSAETTYFTFIISFITVLAFNLWSICLLPFVIPLSKAIIMRCSRCDNILSTHQPYGLLSLKDEILTLKCGECALVISRTYFLVIVSILIVIIIFFITPTTEPHKPSIVLQTTWPEYLKDCGGEVILQNSIRATDTFSQIYEGNGINWDGYLMRINQNYGWFKGEHAIVMLVKMDPSESDIHADLILSMDESVFHYSKDQLKSLDRGSRFRFNATFVSIGNEQQLHHLHALGIEKIEGFMEIPEHVHNVNHRYTLKSQNNAITSS